jgi:uncharacterized caspase-like protein
MRRLLVASICLLMAGVAPAADKRGFGGIKRVHGHRQDVNRYAVVIGISKYKNAEKVTPLKYAVADARAFVDFIKTPVGGGFKAENMKVLLDEQATAQAVRSALGTFLKKAVKDDLVYIYFAGHGAPEPKNPSNLYFLTWEADPDDLFGTALPMDQITYILKKHIFAERVVVLTDACHSAGIGGGLGGTRGGENQINQFVRELARTKPGRAVVTGSRAGEYSQEGKSWGGGHGVFTYHWLEALKGAGDVDGNGIVTLGEAFDYTGRHVAKDTQNNQHPDTLGSFDNDMPLAVHDPRQYEKAIGAEETQVAALEKKVAEMEARRKQLSGKQKQMQALAERRKALEAKLAALADASKRVNCPADMVRIDGVFCIDRYEFPNRAGGEPLVEVDFSEAEGFCKKEGKRICKAAEWTRACAGEADWAYPYSATYQPGVCNDNRGGRERKARAAEFERCKSPEGIFDLSGNVYEWIVFGQASGVIGGSFDDGASDVACQTADSSEAENKSEYVGFRCCL